MSDLSPCPHCGHATAPKIVTAEYSFAAMCDASKPGGPGGCGASGGFARTEAEAAERWNRRAAPTVPQREPLTDEQIVACITEAKCHGGAMRMSYGSGPYEITRPTINAVELTRAIERAHGIASRGTSTASGVGETT